MGKKKKKKNSALHRHQYNRTQRLHVGKEWASTYRGKHIVRGYAKHFGVDKLSAVKELEMLGHSVSSAYKQQLKKSLQQKQEKKRKRKEKREREREEELSLFESDENFAFIAGYTSGGVPFGITWEEQENAEEFVEIEDEPAPISDEDYYLNLIQEDLEASVLRFVELDGKNIMLI